jgi:mRNA interferase RelE/StbE
VNGGPRRVVLTRRGGKELRRLDPQTQRRVIAALDRLANGDPSLDVKHLAGSRQSRVRVGDMRVIFELDREAGEILVHRVVPRGRAYR